MVQASTGHSIAMRNSPSLNAVFVDACKQLLNLRAHHIVGEPDRRDAEELVAFLRRLPKQPPLSYMPSIALFANYAFGTRCQLFIEQSADNYLSKDYCGR